MADRYPLVINPSANQIQEIPSGDTLDLTGNNIKGAGIITATKFVGPMEGTVTGNISGSSGGLSGTPDIIVGNITAATGTFTGNVSIAGTLTYEDVKNVDSVGLITARNGLAVTGGTATFSGAVDANQGIDVDGQTTLDNVNVSGVVTATRFIGDLDAPGLDTNSNGIVVTGVATASGGFSGNLSGDIIGTRTLGTGVTVTAAGVVSATTYYGSGANLTGIDATALKDAAGNVKIQANPSGAVVTGVLTATTFKGDGSQLTGIEAGITTDAQYNMLSIWGSGDNFNGTNAQFNTLIGIDAGKALTTGDYNVGVGYSALASATNNGYNTVVGQLACQNINGASNVSIGYESLPGVVGANVNCHYNVSIGDRAMQQAQGASSNVVIGWWAGKLINAGSNNVCIGYKAGDAIENATNNIIIGHEAAASSSTAQNEITLGNSSTTKFRIPGVNFTINTGDVLPDTDNTQDLGSSAKRWANVYTGDLHLSNNGSGNSVDGTSGSWTMQEGESDLFLINNNTGKKYKFNLTEVS